MVGYTSLSQRNESLALQLLEKHNTLIRSILKHHKCREVKTIGDGFLIEFESALEAVNCASKIQAAFGEHNRSARRDERILVRIGVHVGDVVHRNGDVLGDAVTVASRIVNLAEQGGVCISEEVYAQVRNKVDYPLVRIPEQPVKSVELPMTLYQIVVPLEGGNQSKTSGRWSRIAIIPFANISPDPADKYFADGMTDELISTLSGVQGLRVIARTSVNRYRDTTKTVEQIGNELQVAYVLEGSVRKAGNKIRVTAQLIEVESQEHVWSSSYDRDLDDVFSIQSDIARRVADALEVALLTGERARIDKRDTENLSAYVAYLKGRTLLHDRSEKAITGAKQQFELAIREDPGYAKAYAGLADTYIILGDYLFVPMPSSLEEAKKYIDKALELDPNLPEARVSLANYLIFDYRFEDAEREFRRAIALNPSYATGHHWHASCLEQLGRKDEALAEVLLAEELDPLSTAITMAVIYRCIWAGKYEDAMKRIRKMKEIDPASPLVAEAYMVYHFTKQDWEKALSYLRQMIEADPSDPYLDMDLAYIYAVMGRRDEAQKLIEKLKRVPDSARTKGSLIAFVYAGLNDLDECFRWLEYAVECREVFFGWLRRYQLFENVRRDARFAALLKKAGLPS